MSRKKIEVLFLICLIAMTATITGGALKYALKTFLLPLLVGLPIVVLMIFQIFRESLSERTPVESLRDRPVPRGGLIAGSALVGFTLLIYLAGFLIAIPLGVFLYVKLSGEKWPAAVGLAAGMFAVVFVLSRILGLYLYEGILFL